jgi:EpsI family protein
MNRLPVWPWYWCAAMLVAVAAAALMTPRVSMSLPGAVDLESTIPKSFGDWRHVPGVGSQVDLAVRRDAQDTTQQVYDQILMRTYRNSAGESVMLALAWGRQQRQEVKIHRPELCYVAQGFRLEGQRPFEPLGQGGPEGKTLIAASPRRIEPVIYWVRIGESVSVNAWQTRWYILSEGIAGRIPDGILVRTSQIVRNESRVDQSLQVQKGFLSDLVAALPPGQRGLLLPSINDKIAMAKP